jgi:tetratricopeptide (TPR) repeat protein
MVRPRLSGVVRRAFVVAVAWLVLAGPATAASARGPLTERLRETLAEADRERDLGRLERAGRLYRDVRRASAALGDVNLPLARALDGLADVHRLSGRPDEAARDYLRSIELWESLLGPRQPRVAASLHNLGVVRLEQGRPDRAAVDLRRALAIWEATLGAISPEACNTRRLLERIDARDRTATD